jgi:hypothetical protein
MNKKELVACVNRQYEEMRQEHDKWLPEWQDVVDYVARKNIDMTATIVKSASSKPRSLPRIYDSTAIEASKLVRYGLQGYTVSQALKWLKLVTESEEMMELPGMRQWITDCEKHIYSVLQRSNFYEVIGEGIFDCATLGTTICYPEENEKLTGIVFSIKDLSEFMIDENRDAEVDTVYRKFSLKLYRADSVFDLPDEMKARVENNPNETVEFRHAVFPSNAKDYTKAEIKHDWKYTSVYTMVGNADWCEVSGYSSMPYAVWRWERRSGEVYGKSPALDSMSDILMANQMSKTTLRQVQKQVDPPMGVFGQSSVPDLTPGIKVKLRSKEDLPQPIQTGIGAYQLAIDQFNRVASRIQRQFHSDLFLMLEQSNGQMTAREVIERQGEKAAVLGAIVARMSSEFLDKIIDRVWEIEAKAGRLPQIPPEVARSIIGHNQQNGKPEGGAKIKIEYLGPLAQAQKKYFETSGIQMTLSTVLPMVQFKPDILDNFDLDKMIRVQSEANGLSPDMVIDEKKVAKLRGQRQQAQAQQAAAAQQMQAAQAVAAAGQAPEPGSPGEMLLRGGGM